MALAPNRNGWCPLSKPSSPPLDEKTPLTADAGYHSEDGLKALDSEGIDAYMPDNSYRQRDERDKGPEQHPAKPEPLYDKRPKPDPPSLFKPKDFQFDPERKTCPCPAGNPLYRNGSNCTINGSRALKFQGAKQDCAPCPRRQQGLKDPDKTPTRQVSFFFGQAPGDESHTDRMKVKIDSDLGQVRIARRFATVAPVFGNLRDHQRLDRFTLRGRAKGRGNGSCMAASIISRNWRIPVMGGRVTESAPKGPEGPVWGLLRT